jgi:hypothetical protein
MNKSLLMVAIFVGCLAAAQKAEAATENENNYKSLDTTHNSPWDPRGHEAAGNKDSTGAEVIPEPEQSESDTEE